MTRKTKKSTTKDAGATIAKKFNARPGTIREKLINTMTISFGKKVSATDIQVALYSAPSPSARAALNMVMRGIAVMIEKEKLPYEIVREKSEGEWYFTLRQRRS